MAVEHDVSDLNKLKDIDFPSLTLSSGGRGFEPHVDGYGNPTSARSIAGSGNQGFGRGGSGPEAATGMDRGDFASRTKLTSKP